MSFFTGAFLYAVVVAAIAHFFLTHHPNQLRQPTPTSTTSPPTTNGPSGSYPGSIPVSVNYHFTRKCNYSCSFCFHTATSSHVEPVARAKAGLKLLAAAGMRKINFAGGEPFLYHKMLGEMVDYCKTELRLESVSVVSNGSKITEKWIRQPGHLGREL